MKYDYLNIQSTWSRTFKGFFFEQSVKEMLSNNHISYVANPDIFNAWNKSTLTDYDISVTIGDKTIRLECKCVLVPICMSWAKRDWLSKKTNVIVCSSKKNVPYEVKKCIKDAGILLMEPIESILYLVKLKNAYIQSLLHKENLEGGNNYNTSLVPRIYNLNTKNLELNARSDKVSPKKLKSVLLRSNLFNKS